MRRDEASMPKFKLYSLTARCLERTGYGDCVRGSNGSEEEGWWTG